MARVRASIKESRLAISGALFLVVANARYWLRLAPAVRAELQRWGGEAQAITDPHFRSLAVASLREKRMNVQAAAVVATLAPRRARRDAMRAIVSLQILCDYLDGVTEQADPDWIRTARRRFRAFAEPFSVPAFGAAGGGNFSALRDDAYLASLVGATRAALERLPAFEAIRGCAFQAALQNGEAQAHAHAAADLGPLTAVQWARRGAQNGTMGWQEYLSASAGYVLLLHVLIAVAGNKRTSTADAAALMRAWQPACAVVVLADSLADHHIDSGGRTPGFMSYFASVDQLNERLLRTTRQAMSALGELPKAEAHLVFFVGAVVRYTSEPGPSDDLARPLIRDLNRALAPLVWPISAVLYSWRLAIEARRRLPVGKGELAGGEPAEERLRAAARQVPVATADASEHHSIPA